MRIAVVFDTPYSGWDHADHERQMEKAIAAWQTDEPEMEYQIAHALCECGHEVRLLGVRDDLERLIRQLDEWAPELVFNGAEAYRGDESLEHLLPGLLEREGYRSTGAPPLARPLSRPVRDRIMETCLNPFISYGHDMANAATKTGMEYCGFIQRIVEAAVGRYVRA